MNPLSQPLLLGHRGARRRPFGSNQLVPPENTIEAFHYAISKGCDGVEFDVRFTSDRRSALCHDPKYGRREIATTGYSDLQRRHRLDRRHAPMACLEDVLARFGRTAYLDIELKVGGQEEDVVAAIKAHQPLRGFVVSSFLPDVLRRLHELDASLPLGYVCKEAEAAKQWPKLPISVFIPQYKLVSQAMVDEVHVAGRKLFTWTVNHPRDMVRLANWGVDGLISDDPELLRRIFLASD